MGQYHKIVNLDKREFVDPHQLGAGLKLWEFTNTRTGPLAALSLLLASSNNRGGGDAEEDPLIGSWAGDRIAIVGDYSERGDLADKHSADLIYELCGSPDDIAESVKYAEERDDKEAAERLRDAKPFTDISPLIRPVVEKFCDVKFTGTGWLDIVPA